MLLDLMMTGGYRELIRRDENAIKVVTWDILACLYRRKTTRRRCTPANTIHTNKFAYAYRPTYAYIACIHMYMHTYICAYIYIHTLYIDVYIYIHK